MEYMQLVKTEIFNFTNEVRRANGQLPLMYSNPLDRMGQLHTNEMYTRKFFEHENPYCREVRSLADRINYCGLRGKYRMVGENLADHPAEDGFIMLNQIIGLIHKKHHGNLMNAEKLARMVVMGWYHSPGHKANLLSEKYNVVGFGLLLYPKEVNGMKVRYLLATQNFGCLPE